MAQPKKARFGFPYLWTLVGFCLVGGLAILLRPASVETSYDAKRKQERLNRLAALKKEEAAIMNSYGWANKEKGWVRIPVGSAMELTVTELAGKKPVASTVKVTDVSTSLVPPYLQPAAAAAPAAPEGGAPANAEAAPAATDAAEGTPQAPATEPAADATPAAPAEAPATPAPEAPAASDTPAAEGAATPEASSTVSPAPSVETANPSVVQ